MSAWRYHSAHRDPRAGELAILHGRQGVDVVDAAVGRPHHFGRMLSGELLRDALPVRAGHPGQQNVDRAWRGGRVLDPQLRLVGERAGVEVYRLLDTEPIRLRREWQRVGGLLAADAHAVLLDGRRQRIGRGLRRRDGEAARPKLADDHHRLLAAVVQRPVLELGAFAADFRVIERTVDGHRALGRSRHRRCGGRRGAGRRGRRRRGRRCWDRCWRRRSGRRGRRLRCLRLLVRWRRRRRRKEERLIHDEQRRHQHGGENRPFLHRHSLRRAIRAVLGALGGGSKPPGWNG